MSDTVALVSLEEQIRRVVADQLGVDAGELVADAADQLGVDAGELVADASILDDLGADSLDVVELVMALEEAFDIEVPDAHVEEMRTMGEIEYYVAKRLAPFAG
jgi:acyl carrier protein